MTPLCTFLTPSRFRPARLIASVASIEKTAPREAYRIHVRSSEDDPPTIAAGEQLLREKRIDLHIVRPHLGYHNMHVAWSELLPVTTPWMWVWSDDTLLHGDWVKALSAISPHEAICHAQTVTNNASRYHNCLGGPFPVVPSDVLVTLGLSTFPAPIDTGLDERLRLERGWQTHFLPNVTVQHDRLVDTLLQERGAT